MNRILASLYLDEDVSVVLAVMLNARGFRTITTRDAGNLGASDEDQLAYACREEMVIATHNRADFERLHDLYLSQSRPHWGIIVLARRKPQQTVGNILRLLNRLSADELITQLLYA